MAITTQLVGKLGGGFKAISGVPQSIKDKNSRTLITPIDRSVIAIKWDRSTSFLPNILVNGVEYSTPGLILISVDAGVAVNYSSTNGIQTLFISGAWIADAPDSL